jgi:hypothetical protein
VALQEKAYLDEVHGKRVASLALTLENEHWTQSDVAPEFQQLADSLLLLTDSQPQAPTEATAVPAKELQLNGVKYPVVTSCLITIKLLHECMEVLEHLPNMAANLLHHLIELLLLFNSRTCQLGTHVTFLQSHNVLCSVGSWCSASGEGMC